MEESPRSDYLGEIVLTGDGSGRASPTVSDIRPGSPGLYEKLVSTNQRLKKEQAALLSCFSSCPDSLSDGS